MQTFLTPKRSNETKLCKFSKHLYAFRCAIISLYFLPVIVIYFASIPRIDNANNIEEDKNQFGSLHLICAHGHTNQHINLYVCINMWLASANVWMCAFVCSMSIENDARLHKKFDLFNFNGNSSSSSSSFGSNTCMQKNMALTTFFSCTHIFLKLSFATITVNWHHSKQSKKKCLLKSMWTSINNEICKWHFIYVQ